MANYYRTNAVYTELINRELVPPYFFLSGDEWFIIYGDQSCIPKVIIYLEGKSKDKLFQKRDNHQNSSWKIAHYLSQVGNLPILNIRFDAYSVEISWVILVSDDDETSQISLADLKELFSSFSLPIIQGGTHKAINDRLSNAYHNWQRASLGRNIVVSDIDLVKLTTNNKPIKIIELKRSFIPINKWKPYEVDFANFKLIWEMVKPLNIPFEIVYNRYTKKPDFDDPSNLSVFSIEFSNKNPVIHNQLFKFSDYFN